MNDADHWDEKYRLGRWNQAATCDPFVAARLDDLGSGSGRRALDLACGPGRHALELTKRGWQVDAWDVSQQGLQLLLARASDLEFDLQTRCMDLTLPLPIEVQSFDLVVLVNYLQTGLLQQLTELMRPGSRLLYTTYTRDHPGDHPSPRHCLEAGELERGIPGTETESHEERKGRAGILVKRLDWTGLGTEASES
ncbi:MAG: SAM-dependent methyltransferase [Candidatus Paceibacteria bacterium]|jgi:SAM-dependent methyltransferase